MSVGVPRRIVRPPLAAPFRLNRNSVQAHGLVGWWPLGLGQYGIGGDVLGVNPMTPVNGPSLTPDGVRGGATTFVSASSQYLDLGRAVVSDGPVTLACWFNSNDTDNLQTLVSLGNNGSNGVMRLIIRANSAGDPLWAQQEGDGGGAFFAATTLGITANTWHHGCAIFQPDNPNRRRSAYIDGGNRGDETTATTTTPDFTTIGAMRRDSVQQYMSGMIADVRIYNRALSDAEIWQLYDPATRWDLYEPVTRQIWPVVAPAGGADYTLTAEAGSLSFSGTAATLAVSRTISADAGSLAFSGTAATLVANRMLTAEAGSMSFSGADASLIASRVLTAEVGSLTISGTAAGLIVSRVLSAEVGSLSISGTDASLVVARVLTAAAGSLTFSGTDAGLTYTPTGGADYTLTADPGSLSISGTAAGLVANRVLAAGAGSLSLSGTDANLIAGRVLTAGAGSLSLSGTDAGLIVARVLVAGAGSLTITGTDVTFDYSGATIQVYTVSIDAQPSPAILIMTNISPAQDIDAQPSPAKELEIG